MHELEPFQFLKSFPKLISVVLTNDKKWCAVVLIKLIIFAQTLPVVVSVKNDFVQSEYKPFSHNVFLLGLASPQVNSSRSLQSNWGRIEQQPQWSSDTFVKSSERPLSNHVNHIKRFLPPKQATEETYESSWDYKSSKNSINKEIQNSGISWQPKQLPSCRGRASCIGSKTNDDEALRAMRLELVKQQILKQMRLSGPPNIEDLPPKENFVPPPLLDFENLLKIHNDKEFLAPGNPYSKKDNGGGSSEKIEKIVIFPEEVIPNCRLHDQDSTACFIFRIPDDVRHDELRSSFLWAFKTPDLRDGSNQSFWVSQLFQYNSQYAQFGSPEEPVDVITDIYSSVGWISFNLKEALKKGLRNYMFQYTFQVGCTTCQLHRGTPPIESVGDRKPFIVMNIATKLAKRRSKRSLNCGPGVTECCRAPFVVSFEEMGWSNWIIAPETYNAYYCKGSCTGVTALTQTTSIRTSIVQRYLLKMPEDKPYIKEIAPCCTATKMSSINLIYRNLKNPNTTFKVENFTDMVIESCGCS